MPQLPYHCSIDALVPIALFDKEKREEEERQRKSKLSPEVILADVCLSLGEPIHEVVSKSRKREHLECRMICCYVSKIKTTATLKEIGAANGGRDHTTVINSISVFKDLMDSKNQGLMNSWEIYLENSTLFTEKDFR